MHRRNTTRLKYTEIHNRTWTDVSSSSERTNERHIPGRKDDAETPKQAPHFLAVKKKKKKEKAWSLGWSAEFQQEKTQQSKTQMHTRGVSTLGHVRQRETAWAELVKGWDTPLLVPLASGRLKGGILYHWPG